VVTCVLACISVAFGMPYQSLLPRLERLPPCASVGLNQLLKYLAENFSQYFVDEYDMATPEYMRAQAAFGVE
jgi:hypothetical protein